MTSQKCIKVISCHLWHHLLRRWRSYHGHATSIETRHACSLLATPIKAVGTRRRGGVEGNGRGGWCRTRNIDVHCGARRGAARHARQRHARELDRARCRPRCREPRRSLGAAERCEESARAESVSRAGGVIGNASGVRVHLGCAHMSLLLAKTLAAHRARHPELQN